MSLVDTLLDEANHARGWLAQEKSGLRKLLWIRALVLVVVALIVYSHFYRVWKVNQSLKQVNQRFEEAVVTTPELDSTVFGFVSSHIETSEYTVRLDQSAQALQGLIRSMDALFDEEISLTSEGPNTVRSILSKAKDRPKGIGVDLPYLGAVTLPLGFTLLALLGAFGGLLANLFVFMRYQVILEIEAYASSLLAEAASAGEGATLGRFQIDLSSDAGRWSLPAVKPYDIGFLDGLLSGIDSSRVRAGRSSLLELLSGAITFLAVPGLFAMFWYLLTEELIGMLPDSVLVGAIGLLAILTTLAGALLVGFLALLLAKRRPNVQPGLDAAHER